MNETLFPNGVPEAIFRCGECNEPYPTMSEADNCCYENVNCPDYCFGQRHDPPPARMRQTDRHNAPLWVCPNNYTEYILCIGCNEWVPTDTWSGAVYAVDRGWYCSADDHDLRTCDGCDRWFSYEYLEYDEYGDSAYCSGCYRENGSMAETYEGRCSKCGKKPQAAHPLTEEVACEDHADTEMLPIKDAVKHGKH